METMRPSHDTNQNDAGFPSSPPSASSSSTCSSPSPFSPLPSPTPPRSRDPGFKKSMEEVWKDIEFPINNTLTKHTTNTSSSANPFPGMILQDFLATSLNPISSSSSAAAATFGGPGTNPLPPPATTLSLNSPGPDPVVVIRPNQSQPRLLGGPSIGSLSFGSSIISTFDPFGSSLAFPSSSKKRANPESGGEETGDRRHKRMIKNRESAARSRARKQAYTQELELEVAQLVEENAKLRRQQEKLLAAAVQLPKKHTLGRTLTAPF